MSLLNLFNQYQGSNFGLPLLFFGVVMPLTRSKKPSADAAATQEPAAPPSTQDTSKRQRKRPTPFERGENPSLSTARNKRPKKRARRTRASGGSRSEPDPCDNVPSFN